MISRIKKVFERGYKTRTGHFIYDITVYYSTGVIKTFVGIDGDTLCGDVEIDPDVLGFMFEYSHSHIIRTDDNTIEQIYERRPRY